MRTFSGLICGGGGMMGGCPFGGMDQRVWTGIKNKSKKVVSPNDTGRKIAIRLPREDPITRGRFTVCVKQRKMEPAASVPTSG